MKDGKSLVPEGANQYHAIFGTGPAYFVSASSLGPALVALNAKVKLVSAKGARELPVANFFVAPTSDGVHETAIRADEILTEIVIPAATVKSATYEVRQKDALDWPLATASVVLTMRGTAVGSAKVVMGHVGPVPVNSTDAAKAIAGKVVTADSAEAAGKAAVASAKPLSQNAYKVTLARVAVKRALLDAVKQKV
jgi:xanthine dehydrogenase YagS FAD-binding subunit